MKCLAKEVFEAVRAAEGKAETVMLEAQREAREIIKQAEGETIESERTTALEHRAMFQRLMEEYRVKAQQEIDAGQKQREARRDELAGQARAKLEAAAQCVFERVLNDGDR